MNKKNQDFNGKHIWCKTGRRATPERADVGVVDGNPAADPLGPVPDLQSKNPKIKKSENGYVFAN